MDTIYGAPPTPGPAPTPVPSSDGRGSAIPAARPADEDSVARETLLPSTWHIRHEPTDLPTPEVRIEGEMRGPEDVTDFTVRYGGQAADSVATGSTIAWGVLTLGTGYYGGKGLTAGGRQAIDGVVDGDADKIIDGAVTLGETALEITNAPQAIADALTPDGREPPRASALPRGAGGARYSLKVAPRLPPVGPPSLPKQRAWASPGRCCSGRRETMSSFGCRKLRDLAHRHPSVPVEALQADLRHPLRGVPV